MSLQRQINEYLNEIIGQLVLCTGLFKISFFSVSILFSLGVNVKSQLPSTISHIIKRTLANRKEIITKTNQFTKQINAINELYSKLNTQIQNIFIEQLKIIKAKDLNTNQIDTVREQYQLLLKQIQYKELFINSSLLNFIFYRLRRCEFIRDIYTMENIEKLQHMKYKKTIQLVRFHCI